MILKKIVNQEVCIIEEANSNLEGKTRNSRAFHSCCSLFTLSLASWEFSGGVWDLQPGPPPCIPGAHLPD